MRLKRLAINEANQSGPRIFLRLRIPLGGSNIRPVAMEIIPKDSFASFNGRYVRIDDRRSNPLRYLLKKARM